MNGMTTSGPTASVFMTDFYQMTSAYALWKSGKHNERAVYDYFYRTPPFGGVYALFAGLRDLLDYVARFRYTPEKVARMRELLPRVEPEFFAWLAGLDYSDVRIYAMREGSLAFPRVPMIRVEGPAAPAQMLETHLLALCNFPSGIMTNAARYRVAAGDDKILLEFGLRRAQDGNRASHYAVLGGFDGTSNVEAAGILGEAPKGTMMHAFIEMFSRLGDIKNPMLKRVGGAGIAENFTDEVLEFRRLLGYDNTNDGELAAFIAYALAHPHSFLALVDTYDTLLSGVPNFACVALALSRFGYAPVGIRIDSGDLAFLSREARRIFRVSDSAAGTPVVCSRAKIFVSNDVNEATLWALRAQPHEINGYGIGTHLVTCEGSPAFNGVYKLVAHGGAARIKLSDTVEKVTIPGAKDAYRLIGGDGKIILDLMVEAGFPAPSPGEKVFARHPFIEGKRAHIIPTRVIPLLDLVWDGRIVAALPEPQAVKRHAEAQMEFLREDHLRPLNPTPVKVSVSGELYRSMHELWMREAPVPTLQ